MPLGGLFAPGGYPNLMDEHDERGTTMTGVDPDRLDDQQLMRELETIHRTRHDTLLHGSNDALRAHNDRMAKLEGEYLRRNPDRFVAPSRTREGARVRDTATESGGGRGGDRGRRAATPVGKWGPGSTGTTGTTGSTGTTGTTGRGTKEGPGGA